MNFPRMTLFCGVSEDDIPRKKFADPFLFSCGFEQILHTNSLYTCRNAY